MPAFDDCPGEAAKYHDDYVAFWKPALRELYPLLKTAFGDTKTKNKISQINAIEGIKPPAQINNKNDESLGKIHAFNEAFSALKKYFVDCITQKGYTPSLSEVLFNLKPKPTYATF